MINSVAVGIVYVSGPGQYNIPDGEKGYILTEVVDGLEALSDYKPDANLSWHYWHVHANIDGVVPWQGARWKGLPEDFYKGFDAAVWRQSNNKIYLFKGDQYVRVTPGTFSMDSGYPKSIASNWKNLPSDFTQGIDAGLYVPTNDRIYFFKGDQYARINPADATMDAGYPKPIAGNWKELPSSFNSGIDAAVWRNNKIYLFKGNQYVRVTPGSFSMDAGYPHLIAGNWKDLPSEFTEGIDAALYVPTNNKIYFFKKERMVGKYARINPADATMDSGYPKPIGLDRFEAEALWRDKVLTGFGYPAGQEGVLKLTEDIRKQYNAQNAYLIFFTKYPTVWPAYAQSSWKRVVMRKTVAPGSTSFEDWDSLDRVVAHETGHIFHASDEYADSKCTCTGAMGAFFTTTNGNCVLCTSSGVTSEPDYPVSISGRWKGLPASFTQDIDAAIYVPTNNKIYFFKGSQYARITPGSFTMDSGYPKSIAGNWKGIPSSFENGIDAALYNGFNDKVYLFKGSQYVRITPGSFTMDAGYPKNILNNWKGIPEFFTQNIDAALYSGFNNKIYFFKGSQYVRMTFDDNGANMDSGYPANIAGNWQGLQSGFTQNIDAALYLPTNNKIYIFKGTQYVRMINGKSCLMRDNDVNNVCSFSQLAFGWTAFMDKIDAGLYNNDNDKLYFFSKKYYIRFTDTKMDDGYPTLIAGNWKGIPSTFENSIDAAIYNGFNNKIYLFKGSEYVRITPGAFTMDSGFPASIASNWKGLPASFTQDIDAAIYVPTNNKIYFFKGSQYVRITFDGNGANMDSGFPANIAGNWKGLPASFNNGIDAAIWRKSNNKIYLFKGTQYVRITPGSFTMDEGFPAYINNNWMPFPTG